MKTSNISILGYMIFIATFYLASCGPSKEEMEAREKLQAEVSKDIPNTVIKLNENKVTIYEFHDCQYMVYAAGWDYAWGSHMGDCDNPIHKIKE